MEEWKEIENYNDIDTEEVQIFYLLLDRKKSTIIVTRIIIINNKIK